MAKKKHDEPDEIEQLREPDPVADPEASAATTPVRMSGEDLKAKLRQERREARIKEKGY